MKRFCEDDYAAMAADRERGLTTGQIARKFKCSIGTVNWHLLRLGAEPPVQRGRSWTTIQGPVVSRRGEFEVRRFTPEEDEQLLALEASGMSANRIALRLGRRHNSIIGRMRTLARRDERALRYA